MDSNIVLPVIKKLVDGNLFPVIYYPVQNQHSFILEFI